MLKVLRQQATPATPQDAERLRDALVIALEGHAAARRGTAAEQIRALSARLRRFPTPTGLERQLGKLLSAPARSSRGRSAPEPDLLGPAAAEALKGAMELAGQVALPEPELEERLGRIRGLVPDRLGPKGAARITREVLALLEDVSPIRRRFLDAREACLELVQALAQQIEQGASANARVADRAGALVDALASADPDGVRALQAELVSGLGAIRADADHVRSALEACEERIAHLESQLDAREEELHRTRREACLDPLTQVLNRRGFEPLLDAAIATAHRTGQPLCLAMLDLDHFKSLNDTYGHPMGDMVLQVVARTLEEGLRGREAEVGRIGGEEFALLLSGADPSAAESIAERLRQTLSRKFFVSGRQRFAVTASMGLAELRPGEDREALIERADQALYQAKGEGRNCWRWG